MQPVRAAERPGVDERALRLHVLSWAALAVVVASVVVVTGPQVGRGPGVLGLAALACAVAGLVHVPVPVRGTLEASALYELAYVPVVLLLTSTEVLLVAVPAALVAETIRARGRPLRVTFNVAWVTSALGVAALLRSWLLPDEFVPDGVGVAGALVVAGVIVAVNMVAFSDIVAVRSRGRWHRVLLDELRSAGTTNLAVALLGVLATVLVVRAPVALVLLLAPVAGLRVWMRGRGRSEVRLADERARLERTVDGASDGICLLDRDGRVEVWNPVMSTLTGTDQTQALGRTLPELGLASVVAAIDGGPARVAVGDHVVVARARPVGSVEDVGVVVTLRDVTREEEIARIREDLVSLVSHELRTPVTTLTGFLLTLDAHWDALDEERRRELLAAARRGGERLGSLVGNVVAWARVEERVADGGPTGTCVVGEVLRDVAQDLVVDVAGHGELDVAVALTHDELATVLRNLVGNAVTYGAPPVSVEVQHEVVTGLVHVHVVDHGPGLPDSFRPVLFQPWRQATTGLRRTARGIGMGLAVSRAIAELAGGSIDHADVAGGGSRFTVTLPAD